MGVGPHDGFQLRIFGAYVAQAFGHTPYHVGSSLTQKAGWRDVDVRLMLPDDEYARYFSDPYTSSHLANRRAMWELAWTALGRKLTGLPIDFQIQHQTLANDEFAGPRSALIVLSSDLPFVPESNPEGQ